MNKPVGNLTPEVELDERAEALARLREPFPANQISKLPKPLAKREVMDGLPKAKCNECGGFHATSKVIHLDYVGHAALTDRLLDVDPLWTWEPVAEPASMGLPVAPGGMWIRLTVCGVSRYGFGHPDGKTGGDAVKETIGDALRNAAMRFGAALDLWHKGDLHAHEEEPAATAEELAVNLLRGCGTKELFAEAWEKNKAGWRGVMDGPTYARVVAEMKRLGSAFVTAEQPAADDPKPAPPPPEDRPISNRAQPQADAGFGLGDDEIPF